VLEAVERRIQRALLDQQRPLRHLLDALEHGVAVQRTERDGLQDEEIERSGQQVGAGRHTSAMIALLT